MNEKFSKLGFYPSDILLPKKDVDMSKWAVVACDQFTSEPEYWERVEKTVGDAPSTLRLILPEANLKAPNVDEFIADINASMSKYSKRASSRRSRTPSSTSSAARATVRSVTASLVWSTSTSTTSPPAPAR